jgi:DNA-binding NarL/FixJ family response regulator
MQSSIVRAVSRLLVVEDHPATRAGLVACLEAQPDLAVCGQTDSWREAMVLTRELHPDLLLLDLQLKDGSGWTLIKDLAAAGELPPTLVFSAFDEELHAERLLRAGARGYVTKDAPLERVVEAVRKVLAGYRVAGDGVITRLLDRALGNQVEAAADQEARELLTIADRELQVLQMIADGLGNREVAARLNLNPNTVGTYKARLMQKLGVRTTPELQILALARLKNSHPNC